MQKNKHRKLFSLRFLLFAVLITATVSTVTLSRYITTVSGTATAQVASIALGDVTLELQSSEAGIQKPGDSRTYCFEVSNKDAQTNKHSDVTLEYTIEVQTTGNLPLTLTVKNAGGTVVGSNYKDTIPWGTQDPIPYTLEIIWPASDNDPKYANLVDLITIIVHAEQIN